MPLIVIKKHNTEDAREKGNLHMHAHSICNMISKCTTFDIVEILFVRIMV